MASIIDLSDNMTTPPEPSTSSRSSYGQENDGSCLVDEGFSKVLGPEWSIENVMNLAANSTKVYHNRLLSTAPVRKLEIVGTFLETGTSIQLSGKHLYGALLYTRGNQENKIPCARCKNPTKRIFPKCVSLSTMALGACAADVWFDTNKDCLYHAGNSNAGNSSKNNQDIDFEDDVVVTNARRLSGRVTTTLPGNPHYSSNPTRATRQSYSSSDQFFSRTKIEKPSQEISSDGDDVVGNISTIYRSAHANDISGCYYNKRVSKKLAPKAYSNILVNGKQFAAPSSFASNTSTHSNKRQRDYEADEQPPACRPKGETTIRDNLDYLHGDFDYGATELMLEITPDMIAEATSNNMIRVGLYLLSRFRVETNVMWAVRVAAARWAHGLD